MIEVERKTDKEFLVVVKEGDTKTEHTVSLDDDYYKDLSKGEISKEELIEKSFKFLLKREPKESILSKFNLRLINKYFSEFESEIRRK
jgi:hypothetical protein